MSTSNKSEFPADVKVLGEIGDIVTKASMSAGFDDDAVGDIVLALDEAVTNTIKHGLESDPTKNFELEIKTKDGEVEFFIRENGRPFNFTNVNRPDPNTPIEEMKIGGLGVYFVEKLMDEAEYTTSETGLKTLRMLKRKKQPK